LSRARFKDLCLDSLNAASDAPFWAGLLGLQIRQHGADVWLSGAASQDTIWINDVPESKSVKNRVHLDVFASSQAEAEDLGASFVEQFEHWTVMRAPDGQEFCIFVRQAPPAQRLKDLVVDSNDPEPIARWWADVFGGVLGNDPVHAWWWVDEIPGAPFESMDFVEVPEPKTVKNRVHWDVSVDDLGPLLAVGATLIRPADDEVAWHVLADPQGNEFCAYLD